MLLSWVNYAFLWPYFRLVNSCNWPRYHIWGLKVDMKPSWTHGQFVWKFHCSLWNNARTKHDIRWICWGWWSYCCTKFGGQCMDWLLIFSWPSDVSNARDCLTMATPKSQGKSGNRWHCRHRESGCESTPAGQPVVQNSEFWTICDIARGKCLRHYESSPCLMRNSTLSLTMFNSYVTRWHFTCWISVLGFSGEYWKWLDFRGGVGVVHLWTTVNGRSIVRWVSRKNEQAKDTKS